MGGVLVVWCSGDREGLSSRSRFTLFQAVVCRALMVVPN